MKEFNQASLGEKVTVEPLDPGVNVWRSLDS
jgi:hypothetical protein